MPWVIAKSDNKFCVHKQGEDGRPMGPSLGCHPTEDEAMRQMRALHAREGMMTAPGTYLLDSFVTTTAGQPIRLFPYGQVIKNGRKHVISPTTPFRLPHFRPPIKLGSHDAETPAGGHLLSIFPGKDGWYGRPEYTEKGLQAIGEGHYRYQSPEVIWEDGGLENPQTGEILSGPLIIGAALLHTPHLGQDAALYSVEPIGGRTMSDITVPQSAVEKMWTAFTAWLDGGGGQRPATDTPPPAAPLPAVSPDEFAALRKEKEDMAARVQALEAERAHEKRVAHFSAELSATALKGDQATAALLAGLPDEAAGEIVRHFKALTEQIRVGNLTGEAGRNDLNTGDAVTAFGAEVEKVMRDEKLAYDKAYERVKQARPDLYAALGRN